MNYNPERHQRHSLRLRGFDYSSPGFYFITIVVQSNLCHFGEVVGESMVLNDAGKSIQHEWDRLSFRFPNIELDKYVVMPNHIHGIINIKGGPSYKAITDYIKNAGNAADASCLFQPGTIENSIGRIVQGFKSITTNNYIKGVMNHEWPPFDRSLWQRNFYDRIIRSNNELANTREYIISNPSNWDSDEENPFVSKDTII